MGFRKDALVSAARLVIAIEEAATNEAESGTVATVGVLDVEPSSINVVPGKATLWVDLRGVDEESINCALSDIRDAVSEIAKNDSITITMDMLTADNPVALSEELAAKLDESKVTLSIKAGEGGRAFGSVSNKEISKAITDQLGLEIDKKKIVLNDPIKSIGSFEVPIKLHKDVTARLAVKVVEA